MPAPGRFAPIVAAGERATRRQAPTQVSSLHEPAVRKLRPAPPAGARLRSRCSGPALRRGRDRALEERRRAHDVVPCR
eukprot:9481798-Pyramimonas_sp.AAC.1